MDRHAGQDHGNGSRPPSDKGRWAAMTAGMCAISFGLASGYAASPASPSPQAWFAICGVVVAGMLSKMAGHIAAYDYADAPTAKRVNDLVRGLVLFAALATGFSAFVIGSETARHSVATEEEDVGPKAVPSPPLHRSWQKDSGNEAAAPHVKPGMG